MTQATYWRTICDTRCTAGYASLVDDPWCRRLLSEAAERTLTTGFSGRTWVFADDSLLIANPEGVLVL